MTTIRYYLALFAVVMYPPAVASWFLLHPLVRVWRRTGPVVAYLIVVPLSLAMILALYALRRPILAHDFGANGVLMAPGVLLLAAGMWLDVLRARKLGTRVVLGLPELRGDDAVEALVQTGVYARVRHPRYVAVMIGVIGIALISNYLATYVLIPVIAAGLHLVAVLEERELVQRFGEAYRAYQRRVPRFIPRWRTGET